MATENKTLGKFILDGIPPAPRGVPQVEVTFDIDANGILNVSAKDKGTGKEQKITITASSGLSDDEIEQMINDAESHAEEDEKKKKLIEVKNNADSIIYQADKLIDENKEKISDEITTKINEQKLSLKTSLESDDVEKIEAELYKDGNMKNFRHGGLNTLIQSIPSAYIIPVSINNSWKFGRKNYQHVLVNFGRKNHQTCACEFWKKKSPMCVGEIWNEQPDRDRDRDRDRERDRHRV